MRNSQHGRRRLAQLRPTILNVSLQVTAQHSTAQQDRDLATTRGRTGRKHEQNSHIANMLLLDYQNVLIQSVLTERFSGYLFPLFQS
jgi:hypothetical protein